MFCDLVGSTALSQILDPEDMLEIITHYRETCVPVIEHYDGYVSRYMGDGILALFGYPIAHEDDAEHAVLASLGIVERLETLNESLAWLQVGKLRVRLGIATGLVVAGNRVGEGASEEETVVGEPPNLASRLQGLARPNSVVISETTHRLLAGRFKCKDLGLYELKGFAQPQPAWEVIRTQPISSRFAAAHAASMVPLVDRLDVMELLLDRWSKAQRREGQVVLMLGEPGIGKSRVTRELRNRACEVAHLHICYQCSPYYSNSALYPFVDQLGRAAGFETEDSSATRLEKLHRVLSMAVEDSSDVLPLMASMLSIAHSEPETLAGMTAERRRERILEALIEQFQGLAAKHTLLMTFEDVHWIDPTSLELIERFVGRLQGFPVLAVFTTRPGFAVTWEKQPNVSVLNLERLERSDGAALVEQVVGAKQIPTDVHQQIFERTDGIPLFLEELTKALLESEFLEEREHDYVVASTLPTRAIPVTLQDSLMARLDQLAEAKRVAQIGAAIGRQFSRAMLAALASNRPELGNSTLESALQRLVEADLLVVRGSLPNTVYRFKHALMRDAAYDSMLRSQREQIHSQIVVVLEEQFREIVDAEPELLAHHCAGAHQFPRAVDYWLAAGRRAAERSANVEAIHHFRDALGALPRIRDEANRKRVELELRVALGAPLISTRGPGSTEVEQDYTRALELCEEVPESEQHFEAHWGWWRVSMNHRIGRERADTLIDLAARLDEPGLLLQAHHCQWATLFHLGDHEACRRHVAAGLALYDPEVHRRQASLYGGHDARVCAFGERALSLWLCGWPDQARAELAKALDWASALGHAGSLAHARDYALVLAGYQRDVALVGALAEQMIEFAQNEGLPDYLQRAVIYRGWAIARSDDGYAGLDLMEGALQRLAALGTKEDLPMFLDLMAQVHHDLGNADEALGCVQQAFAESSEAGLQFWLAELHRRNASVQLELSEDAQIEAALRRAMEIAQEQGALAFELRAAVDLAQLYRRQGKRQAARTALAAVRGRYQEGQETAELRRARALLNSLD
jgi:class 3 adenylate cyclase/predicted ATPase